MVRKTHLRLVETPQPVNGGLRIAFASSDQQSVDQHFGTAIGFVIYELSESAAQQVEICRFAASAQDGDHGKLIDRMLAIESCDAVYACAIGASAVRQLISMQVQPLRVEPGVVIKALVTSLQQQLRNHPPRWIQRLQREAEANRFDVMEAEGWCE